MAQQYVNVKTGEVMSQGQWRQLHKNMSLPRTWKKATLDALNLAEVAETPKPEVGKYQVANKGAAEQDAKGNWVQAWVVRDMFSDYTDEDGVTHTKAEQEAAYQARLDETAATSIRTQRDKLLAESDWVVIMHTEKGTNIPLEWETYRQALRDVPEQEGFPFNVTWPQEP